MTFFKLEHSVDPAEIGIFDQVQRFRVVPGSLEPHAFMNIPLEGELDLNKQFPQLFLEKKAKWTDFLHIVPGSGDFLLICPRVLSLMQEHEMDVYQSHEVEVVRGKESYLYHLLRFPWSRNRDYIDWEKSVFAHTTQFGAEIIEELKFSDYEGFYAFKRPLFKKKEALYVQQLFLMEAAIEKDMFRLLFISSGVYVSERLTNAMQDAGITGCRFTPLADLGLFLSAKQT